MMCAAPYRLAAVVATTQGAIQTWELCLKASRGESEEFVRKSVSIL